MVQRKDLLSLGFYRLSPFHGSDRALSYRIEKIEEVKAITGLRVTTYPGPYNFQNTDDSLKETKDFPFEAASLDAITDYLNSLPQPELHP